MRKIESFNRVLLSPFVSYLIVAGLIFVGLKTNQLINQVSYDKSRLKDVQLQDKDTQPSDIFFKDVAGEWDQVNIIDKSFSLASLRSLNYDLQEQVRNTKSRLIVFIDDTTNLNFERETTDILRLADSTKTSLLAINFGTQKTLLDISPDAGTHFTDQEAQQFVNDTIKSALRDNKLEFAVASTIEKFQMEITGKNFYTASDLRLAQLSTATSGTAKDDYLSELRYLNEDINDTGTQAVIYALVLLALFTLGLYHIWRTTDRVWGFLFGLGVGFTGYVIAQNLTDNQGYFSYEEHVMPLIITTIAGGFVGLFVDYVLSHPNTPAPIKSVQKSSKPIKK